MMEYEVLVNRYGNVLVYKRYANKRLKFWMYARTVEQALGACSDHPVTIVRQGS